MGVFLQGNLCGGGTFGRLFLPIMQFAPHACNFFLLWSCTANGSWKMIALIFKHSCSVRLRVELESHDLGHSLLFTVRDDDVGLHDLSQCATLNGLANPL